MQALKQALNAIGTDYGAATARMVAMQLEYPGGRMVDELGWWSIYDFPL